MLARLVEEEVWEGRDLPGTVEVRDEDGGFHRRFGGTDPHIDVRGSGSR